MMGLMGWKWKKCNKIKNGVLKDLKDFVDNYSREDFEKIKFAWNGKYGAEYSDENEDFRLAVCNYIFPIIRNVSLLLIRDLYMEFARGSEAIFGAYTELGVLGEQLLIRGQEEYLLDYLRGASFTLDTYAMSSKVNLDKDLAERLLHYMEHEISTTSDPEKKCLFEQIGLMRVKSIIARCDKQASNES